METKERVYKADYEEIMARQNYCCAITGEPLTPTTASADHIVPCAKGGKHVKENIQIVHKAINQIKAAFDNTEFINWCRKVVKKHGMGDI